MVIYHGKIRKNHIEKTIQVYSLCSKAAFLAVSMFMFNKK